MAVIGTLIANITINYNTIHYFMDVNKLTSLIKRWTQVILICDVMVHPEYQKQGIGKKVMKVLLKKCDEEGIKWVQLFCAKGKQNFYKKLGFVKRESDTPGMSLFL